MNARPVSARRERGTILFIALIVLVAMSLAGIALMRSVDTNVLIAGNLAFRQGATAGGDWGIENARAWISANAAELDKDKPDGATFYWANWQENLDLIGNNPNVAVADYNWSDPNEASDLGFDTAGNRVQYVIHRLCDKAGAPNVVQCVKSKLSAGTAPTDGGSNQVQPVGGGNVNIGTVVLYRVTVRVTGPRNTVSFVQAVLN
jgi:Tfp pilus assembly protein PilX